MSDRTGCERGACFEVDGTVFRSCLGIELVEALIAQGSFPESVRDTFRVREAEWRDRKGDYESYIEAVVRAFMEHLKGLPVAEFDRASSLVIDRNHDRVYRYTRDLVSELKRDGYFLLAISHSPKWLLDKFCKEYGFDKVYGKRYEIDAADRFTGAIVDDAVFENKAEVLRRAVAVEGLTLEGSVGVGDTEGDIPMLSLVARPICFNPNASLYAHAQQAGWGVVVERKDVIYRLPF